MSIIESFERIKAHNAMNKHTILQRVTTNKIS